MTVNTGVPLDSYQDGPRSVSGTVDAAIDARPYEVALVVAGPGRVSLLVKADMKYVAGVTVTFDGASVTLNGQSAPAGYGSFVLHLEGTTATVRDAAGKTLVTATGTVAAGLRTRYSISGGARVTTQGRLL